MKVPSDVEKKNQRLNEPEIGTTRQVAGSGGCRAHSPGGPRDTAWTGGKLPTEEVGIHGEIHWKNQKTGKK